MALNGPAPPAPREAWFYERLPDGRVHCSLCPHNCRIADGTLGACGVRVNYGGTLYTLVADRVVARSVDPIEKKPLFHFLPGSSAYSIATVGCCLRCSFCQNWEISQWPREHLPRRVEWTADARAVRPDRRLLELQAAIPGDRVGPGEIVDAALAAGAQSIAYTYVEPTIFYELAYETAVLARARGLKNIFVTCGYTEAAPLRMLAQVLDAANVDLKFFRDDSYTHISRGRLQPVLDAIRRYHDLGVWTEVTTLVIPGVNDGAAELEGIAEFIRSVGAEIPWHLSRFFPAYQMLDRPPTPLETLRRARQIGLDAGLKYVYLGNVPDDEAAENTHCACCGALLIERRGYTIHRNRVVAGCCPDCGTRVDGVQMDAGKSPKEGRCIPQLDNS
jgi:pyruvate formate lyase activating enzyme